MAPSPSNEGLYKVLYQELASNLGCSLSIQRYPKKRTHLLLKEGEVDLYPSTGFDLKRSEYLYYIPNGLYRYEFYFGLTPNYVKSLTAIPEINSHGLTWIFESGSTTINMAETLSISNQPISELTDERAITMLTKGRKVFYRIIKGDYVKYLKKHDITDLTGLNILTHKSCCKPKSHKLYTGISRKSANYIEEINPHFKKKKAISAENFPFSLSKDSLAYSVANEIKNLRKAGRIDELYQQFIVVPGHTQ